MQRRDFLKKSGLVVLSVAVVPFVAGAEAVVGLVESAVEGFTVTSGTGLLFRHFHDIVIPVADLRNPPADGVVLRTTEAAWHSHTVKLDKYQLLDIAQGKLVKVRSSFRDHVFEIQLNVQL